MRGHIVTRDGGTVVEVMDVIVPNQTPCVFPYRMSLPVRIRDDMPDTEIEECRAIRPSGHLHNDARGNGVNRRS